MSVKVRIPSPLRSYTNGADVVEAQGASVAEVLNSVKAAAPGIETRLFKGPAQLNRFVNVYLNDEDIRFLKNLETPVKEGDEISIVPAIAGGSADCVNVKVRLSTAMRGFVGGADAVEVCGHTVGDVLTQVAANSNGLQSRLFKHVGQVSSSVNVFLNDENIRFLRNLDTPLRVGDEISVLPHAVGG
ncbi:MAG: moaD [Phycisphaerales bacterium]|jgi:molybdopterin synthase sulfur carrier subunit|nr:moaD [Phycisphaerales bacterium]